MSRRPIFVSEKNRGRVQQVADAVWWRTYMTRPIDAETLSVVLAAVRDRLWAGERVGCATAMSTKPDIAAEMLATVADAEALL